MARRCPSNALMPDDTATSRSASRRASRRRSSCQGEHGVSSSERGGRAKYPPTFELCAPPSPATSLWSSRYWHRPLVELLDGLQPHRLGDGPAWPLGAAISPAVQCWSGLPQCGHDEGRAFRHRLMDDGMPL